uniref:hypothetical protein n=1 Tax=Marinobacterium profundum TaxID=1714300 RepID=UPI000ACABC24|nr:hypothetical protein [Marinobacterium profundum]
MKLHPMGFIMATDVNQGRVGFMRETDLVFFQPLWRRVAATVFCVLWSVFEWATNSPFWGMVSLGFVIYCYWMLFHTFEEIKPGDKAQDQNKS